MKLRDGGKTMALIKEIREQTMVENQEKLPFYERAFVAGKISKLTWATAERREISLRNKNMMSYEPGEIEAIADRKFGPWGFAEYHDGDWHQR